MTCYGTPFFLKRRFGSGYTLRVAKNLDANTDTIVNTVKANVQGTVTVGDKNIGAPKIRNYSSDIHYLILLLVNFYLLCYIFNVDSLLHFLVGLSIVAAIPTIAVNKIINRKV